MRMSFLLNCATRAVLISGPLQRCRHVVLEGANHAIIMFATLITIIVGCWQTLITGSGDTITCYPIVTIVLSALLVVPSWGADLQQPHMCCLDECQPC